MHNKTKNTGTSTEVQNTTKLEWLAPRLEVLETQDTATGKPMMEFPFGEPVFITGYGGPS